MKRIFIGGTGRSGTTILQHILSFHHELYTVPVETKFIVQSDGLHSLVQHLTDDFSITDASIALARFKTLMYDVITQKGPNPYVDLAGQPYGQLEFVPQDIFPNYWKSLYAFFNKLSNRHYRREQIVKSASVLVDSLFGANATQRGAQGWVEKTPSNLFRIEFLDEMFPDALFINCIRDPRGVLDSFMRKKWLSGSLEEGSAYLVSYYEYVARKRRFGQARKGLYYEVRLESLVADPIGEIGKLLDFLEVTPFTQEINRSLPDVLGEGSIHWVEDQQKYCDTWELSFSKAQRKIVSAVLADVIEDYGYLP